MFDKELFLLLCPKHNVEFNKDVSEPMIKDKNGKPEPITKDKIREIFLLDKCEK